MKKPINIIFAIFSFLLLFQPLFAQKLTIIEQDYEKAKNESKNQNKLLLIDFYTVWCGPCKEIERKIFEDQSVSSEMSKSFIVLRYDAEKDEEHQLSLKHHIGSYPTTIVLNTDQFVISKLYGFGGADKDLVKNYQKFLNEAVEKNKNHEFIKGVSNSNKGFVYPKFYQDYVYRVKTDIDEEKLLQEFWETNTDYLSEISFNILAYFGATDKVTSFFLDNRQKYQELYGKVDVDYVKSKMSMKNFSKALEAKDRKKFDEAVIFMNSIFSDEDEKVQQSVQQSIDSWEQNMLMEENRWNDAFQFLLARQKRHNLDDGYADNFCYNVYRKSNDAKVLKQCVNLMKTITKKQPTFSFLHTYGLLLYKANDLKLSKSTFEKAIKAGKLEKEDTKSSEKWLKTVQEKLSQSSSKKRS